MSRMLEDPMALAMILSLLRKTLFLTIEEDLSPRIWSPCIKQDTNKQADILQSNQYLAFYCHGLNAFVFPNIIRSLWTSIYQ